MATDKEFIGTLIEKLAPLEVTAKPMFGEYGLYFQGKNFALVCDNTLYVKVTTAGAVIADRVAHASPYEGAKPAFRISSAKLNDRDWITKLVRVERRAADAQEEEVVPCCQNDRMIIESPGLVLRALTRSQAEQIVTEDRTGQSWAPDYPTSADVGIAAIALAGRATFPSDVVPWGLFVIVEKSSGQSVGGIGFKGGPNDRREVEIGYGVCPSRQRHGVASEALNALCEFAQGRVGAVVAETDRDNIASQRVLEKCGFHPDGGDHDLLRWRRELPE